MVREAMGALRTKDEWDPRAMRHRGFEYLETSTRGHYEWTRVEATVSLRPGNASGAPGTWPPPGADRSNRDRRQLAGASCVGPWSWCLEAIPDGSWILSGPAPAQGAPLRPAPVRPS